MMMASTRSGGVVGDHVAADGDADDRVDGPCTLGEVGVVVDVDGDARNVLLLSRTHEVPPIGMTTTVMLSWPPAAKAYSTSARAAASASAPMQNRAMSSASGR